MTYPTILPKPRNEQDFEDLCRDLFAVLWGGAELYGRRFQNQHGIDVCGRTAEGRVAVQCKNHMSGLKTAVIDVDIAKARGLAPPLQRLIFATSAARDTGVQDHVAGVFASASKPGFAIDLWFWDDICRKLDDDEGLRARWVSRLLGQDEPPLIDVGRLPSTILPRLIGREAELVLLEDAWIDRAIRVQSVVAVGGAGKTALVHHWMQGFEDAGWKKRGVAAAYAWSFYSQGGGDDR